MTDMLKIHQKAMEETSTVIFHEFLLSYKKQKKCIYAFVEGKTDPSFYADKIKNELPDDWDVDYWSAGSKRKVIGTFKCFDWKRFERNQIIFFIDRDFSKYLNEETPLEHNLYITDWYSIENSLVNRDVCKRILQDIKGMALLRGEEMDKVLYLFEKELKKFHKVMLNISAHMIAWRQKGNKVCAENLKMNDLFEFNNGRLKLIVKSKGRSGIPAYLCEKFSLHRRGISLDLKSITNILNSESNPKNFVRGKYELWFLIYFCKNIYENYMLFSSGFERKPKAILSLSLNNALAVIGPRARTPDSLKTFLSETVVKFSSAR